MVLLLFSFLGLIVSVHCVGFVKFGTNQYGSFTSASLSKLPVENSNYTLEAWIKPTVHGVNGILGWGRWGTQGYTNALRLGTSATIHNYWWNIDLISSVSDLSGKWHHVAVTYDGYLRSMYLDGQLVGQGIPASICAAKASDFRIGCTNGGEYFQGWISYVRIWNKARNQGQIQLTMNTVFIEDTSGLVNYWALNEGSGTALNDLYVNGMNGVLTGGSAQWDLAEAGPPVGTTSKLCDPSSEYTLKGPTAYTDRKCALCSTCPSGSYQKSGCDGLIDTVCTPCTTSCAPGSALSGSCTSTTTPICLPCHPLCTACTITTSPSSCSSCVSGITLSGTTCVSPCTSTQYYSAQGTCLPCDSSCSTCVGGTFTDCSSCGTGLVLNPDKSCNPSCPQGYFVSKGVCVACKKCGALQFQTSACSALQDTVCKTCNYTYQYYTGISSSPCQNATVCTAGQAELTPPTFSIDRVCRLCQVPIEFQDQPGQKSCKPISAFCSVTQTEVNYPTPTSDRTCASCADTFNSYLEMDGNQDFVSFSWTAGLPAGNSSYTTEAWIKPYAHGNTGIISWGRFGYYLSVNAFRLMGTTQIVNYWWNYDIVGLPGNLANSWHHVAATYDGTRRTLYVDGIVVATDVPTVQPIVVATNFRIGSSNNGEFFSGIIHSVRVWNISRSQSDIQSTMKTMFLINDIGLVGYWPLYAGCGTTAVDISGKAANGTINGAIWIAHEAGPGITTAYTVCSNTTEYEITAPTLIFDRKCAACTSCPAGTYITGGCNGRINTLCANCTSSCATGYYMTGSCGGASNPSCQQCNPSCKTCDGPTISDCTSCPSPYVLSGGICTSSCSAGFYPSSSSVCTPCASSCASCTGGSSTQCSSCSSSTFLFTNKTASMCVSTCPSGMYKNSKTQTCSSCSSCALGQIVSPKCTATADTGCANCDGLSQYADVIGLTSCKIISPVCTPGTYESKAPSSSNDRVCLNCPANTFQDLSDQSSCNSVAGSCDLDEIEISSPTPTSNRVCRICQGADSVASFNGVNSYAATSSSNEFPFGNDPYTLEAWVWLRSNTSGGIISLGTTKTALKSAQMFIRQVGKSLQLVHSWWVFEVSTAFPYVASDTWHHVAAAYDGTFMSLFLDGQLSNQTNPGVQLTLPISGLTFGMSTAAFSATPIFLNGSIAFARIWSVGKVALEISDLMNYDMLPTASNLIGSWPLREGCGSLLDDHTPFNNDAVGYTLSWETAYPAPLPVKSYKSINDVVLNSLTLTYLTFDGAGDRVSLPSLQIGGDFSIEVVFRYQSLSDWARILEFKVSSSDLSSMIISPNDKASGNQLRFVYISYKNPSSPTYTSLIPNYPTLLNTWYHVVVRVTAGGYWSMWINGELRMAPTLRVTLPLQTYSLNGIGGNPDVVGQNGDVALVRVYQSALTDDEIIGIYSVGSVPKSVKYSWDIKVPGPQGSEVIDSVGAAHGTLLDDAAWATRDTMITQLTQTFVTFDGANDYIDLPTVTFGGDFTIETVYRHQSFQNWARVFEFRVSDSNPSLLAFARNDIANGNTVRFVYANKTTSTPVYTTMAPSFPTLLGVWHHAVITVTKAGYWSMWIDGTKIFSATKFIPLPIQTFTVNGVGGNDLSTYQNGEVAFLRIYSNALTDGEIISLYSGDNVPASVKYSWEMNLPGPLGLEITDSIGGANGTLKNGASFQTMDNVIDQLTSTYLTFDGKNDKVVLPSLQFGGSSGVTFQVTYRHNTLLDWARVFQFQVSSQDASFLALARDSLANSNVMRFFYANASTTPTTYTTMLAGQPTVLNEWRHAIVVVSPTGYWSMWINGERVNAPSKFISLPLQTYSVNAIAGVGSTSLQNGDVSLLRIYGSALSDSEVVGLFNAGNVPSSVLYSWELKVPGPSGAEVLDSVGGANGALFDTASWETKDVMIDQITTTYLTFDGSTDSVFLPALAFGGAFTVEAVYRQHNHQDYARVFQCQLSDADVSTIALSFDSVAKGENLRFFYSNFTNSPTTPKNTIMYSPVPLTLNQWDHAVVVVTADGLWSMWIDGARVVAPTKFIPLPLQSYLNCSLGGLGARNIATQDGDIALVRLYSSALSDAEVLSLYGGNIPKSVQNSWEVKSPGSEGAEVVDSVGKANGKLVGNAAFATKDVFIDQLTSTFLSFDGTGDSVSLPTMQLGGPLTFEVIYRHDTLRDWARVLQFKETTDGPTLAIARSAISTGNVMRFLYNNKTATTLDSLTLYSQLPTVLNKWHHLIVTSTASGVWTMWLDGALAAPPTKRIPLPLRTYTISAICGVDNYLFQQGDIALVRIYGQALTMQQIIALYGNGAVPSSLIHSWNPGYPSPSGTLRDDVQGADGTLVGNAHYVVSSDSRIASLPLNSWSFSEGRGTVISDLGPASNTMYITNGDSTNWITGASSSAFNFTSTSIQATLTSVPGILATNFSISLWVYPNRNIDLQTTSAQSTGTNTLFYPPRLAGNPIDATGHFGISLGRNGIVAFTLNPTKSLEFFLRLPYNFTTWTQLTIVLQSNVPHIYANGQFVARGTAPSCPLRWFSDSVSVSSSGFLGAIDELNFYSHSLNSSELAAVFAAFACSAGSSSINGQCVSCSPGTYVPKNSFGACALFACPLGYVDDDLDPSTPCTLCNGVDRYQNRTSQTSCVTVSQCLPGFEPFRAPTSSSDRVCRACRVGFFQSYVGTSSCSAFSNCSAGEQEKTPPTSIADRTCVSCSLGFTFKATSGQVQQCQNVSVCGAGSYISTAATLTSDVVCANCSAGLFLSGTACKQWSTCLPGFQETQAPSYTSDRTCNACPSGTFKNSSGQALCQACASQCAPGKYLIPCGTGLGQTSDGVCVDCPAGTFSDQMNNATYCSLMNTTCPTGSYMTSAGNKTQNIQCSPCSACGSGSYITGGCSNGGLSGNTQCGLCTSSCTPGLYLEGTCNSSSTSGPACKKCDPSCATCSGSGSDKCMSCSGTLSLQGSTCVAACAAGQYRDESSGTCANCSSTCAAKCTGGLSSQCLDCKSGTYLLNGTCLGTCQSMGAYFHDSAAGVCRSCSSCDARSYISVACTESNDTVCMPISQCGGQQFISVNASKSSDVQCANCTVCPIGTSISSLCQGTSNTQCTACNGLTEFQNSTNQHYCQPVKDCPAGYAQNATPTASTDRQCRMCNGVSEYQPGARSMTCLPVTDCGVGEQEQVAPTYLSNRVCVSCVSGLTYKAVNGSSISCVSVSTCGIGQGETVAPTTSSNRVCGACSAGFYQTKAGQTSCVAASQCQVGYYQSQAASPSSDTSCSLCDGTTGYSDNVGLQTCSNISICSAGQIQLVAPSSFRDRVCVDCNGFDSYQDAPGQTSCKKVTDCLTGTFSSSPPTISSNRVCSADRTCQANEFELRAPTPLTNRVCQTCSQCDYGYFSSASCTATADTTCKAWTFCISTLEYEILAPTPTSDRICKGVTSCLSTEYELRPSTKILDRVCAPLTTCDYSKQWQSVPPTATSNRQCAPISTCKYGVMTQRATQTSDTVCTASVVVAFPYDYDSVLTSPADVSFFTNVLSDTIQNLLGLPDPIFLITVTRGSILATVTTTNQTAVGDLNKLVADGAITFTFKDKTLNGMTKEQAAQLSTSNASSKMSTVAIVMILLAAVLLVVIVVNLLLYIQRRNKRRRAAKGSSAPSINFSNPMYESNSIQANRSNPVYDNAQGTADYDDVEMREPGYDNVEQFSGFDDSVSDGYLTVQRKGTSQRDNDEGYLKVQGTSQGRDALRNDGYIDIHNDTDDIDFSVDDFDLPDESEKKRVDSLYSKVNKNRQSETSFGFDVNESAS